MKRVVITGLGTINPLGNDIASFWDRIVKGKSAAANISKFDTSQFKTKIGCEVINPPLSTLLSDSEIKRSDLYTQYGLYAAAQAVEDAGLDLNKLDPFSCGVVWGTGQGGLTTLEASLEEFHNNDKKPHFNPLFIPKMLGNMAAGMISMKFGFMGVCYSNHAACASANAAMMDASMLIKQGKAKLMVVGGSDASITPATVGGFNALRALSTNNESPLTASKPFDSQRDGFVLSEGAAALILEDYDHAISRNATIYAEIVGSSVTNDAYHITASNPSGKGAIQAMKNTLNEANISPDLVDYLNPHATSTTVGDKAEACALNNIWSNVQKPLKISATKSITGHHLGAAGAIEAIICIKALNTSTIPPTINVQNIDRDIEALFHSKIQLIRDEAVNEHLKYAMSNSFGFGGHNAVCLFKKL